MTQEDKELLLKDLCARMPYEVKICCNNTVYNIDAYTKSAFMLAEPLKPDVCLVAHIEDIKPYLFPMSSMTEEQKTDMIKSSCGIGSDKNVFDWYNKNNLDYRGLIPMDLAIDATDKNIY